MSYYCDHYSSLLPYLHMLMDPLVSALNGSQTLISQVYVLLYVYITATVSVCLSHCLSLCVLVSVCTYIVHYTTVGIAYIRTVRG